MKNDKIRELLDDVQLPDIVKVHQHFSAEHLDDPEAELFRQLSAKELDIRPGMRIAITAGSRGLVHYVELLRTIIRFVREKGGEPFLVPSMGSHGGGTAEGQLHILENLGVTEDSVGAPIRSSMEVVQIGTTSRGLPAYIDKIAYESDGIIVFNKVKPHPGFRGPYESGLVKMMAIGLAKHKGASMTHCLRVENMAENIAEVAAITLKNASILCGVATVENAYGGIARIHVLRNDEILEKEPDILKEAWAFMPRIYLDRIDSLIVSQIGKDISGAGSDPNVTGKHLTSINHAGPQTTVMGILDLSPKTGSNPHGMGLAEFMSKRIYDKMDVTPSYINSLTSLVFTGARMPVVLEDDLLVFKACVKASGVLDLSKLALVVIQDTKHLDTIYLSRGALETVVDPSAVSQDGDFFPIPFDADGACHLF